MDRRTFIQHALILGCAAPCGLLASTPLSSIRIGYFDTYWPFSQREDNGSMRGLLIDSLEAVAQAAKLPVTHVGYPWARAQAMVEHGDLDAFCTVPTQARLKYALFCHTPIITIEYGFYHRADDPRPAKARSLEDLRPLVQASYHGAGYAREYMEADRMVFLNDEDTIMKRIALGTIDVLAEGEFIGKERVKRLGLQDKLVFTPAPWLPKAGFTFGIRRTYPDAEAIVKKMEIATVAALHAGTLKALTDKYR